MVVCLVLFGAAAGAIPGGLLGGLSRLFRVACHGRDSPLTPAEVSRWREEGAGVYASMAVSDDDPVRVAFRLLQVALVDRGLL